jgi:hypothetical protein
MPNEQTSVPLFASGEVLTAANMNISAGTGVPVFATTVTRDAAFGGTSEKVLAEGQLCYLSDSNIVQYYNGAAWATVGPSTSLTMAVFNETQAAGTNGGTSTSGSFLKRTLNTTVKNDISGCSIASSVITLPAGTFYVLARSPLNQSDQARAKIRNTTDSTDLALSGSGYLPPATSATIDVTIQGFFVLAASKTIELQYRVATGTASNGLGINTNFGVDEVYSSITIMKVA